MNKTQLTLITTLLMASYAANAQEKKIKFGYNAIQATVQNRFRAYNNVTFEMPGNLELRLKLMNQTKPAYTSGWETISLVKKGTPIGPLYVTRIGGPDINNIQQSSQGFGIRADLGDILPHDIYGNLDFVVWKDRNEEWVGKGEIFLFVGKQVYGNAIETLLVYRPDGNNYNELEIISKGYPTSLGTISFMTRLELTNFEDSTLLAGMQITF